MRLDESLFERKTPWAACVALEMFFAEGGRCVMGSDINWLYLLGKCNLNRMTGGTEMPEVITPPHLHEAFAWAHLEISISKSLAESNAAEDQSFMGPDIRSMWVRSTMIARCGHIPGDCICDLDELVNSCMSDPGVRKTLQMEEPVSIPDIHPDVRLRAENLAYLVASGRMENKGDIAELLRRTRALEFQEAHQKRIEAARSK